MWARRVEEHDSMMYGHRRRCRARVLLRAVFEGCNMADAANVVCTFLALLCLLAPSLCNRKSGTVKDVGLDVAFHWVDCD
jgi:hypothetical protein